MIQNADDAEATEVCFLFDERNFGEKSLVHPELARFQGPALYSHNNATFKDKDWEGIRNLMNSNKKEDPLKIGRFGIGFNSVYHITGILQRLGAIHKGRPGRGWEGGCRNPDKLGHREDIGRGSYSTTRTSELKKNKNKKHICLCGIKRY